MTAIDRLDCRSMSTTVKSFNFVGMKFHGLRTLDMLVDLDIFGFQIICNKCVTISLGS